MSSITATVLPGRSPPRGPRPHPPQPGKDHNTKVREGIVPRPPRTPPPLTTDPGGKSK